MQTYGEDKLTSRERTLLNEARANGYWGAPCRTDATAMRAYNFWCWRLRIPLVWLERRSPRSKYGRVHLDLFTTPTTLTFKGQDELKRLGAAVRTTVSPHDACWDGVPIAGLETLAHAVLRCATRTGNYRLGNVDNRPLSSALVRKLAAHTRRPAAALPCYPRREAIAGVSG